MNIGWIKLNRSLIEWEWYSDIPVRLTFIHLLLLANWEDKNWQGVLIKRGQCITGRNETPKTIGITVQQYRTAIKKLKSTHEITTKSTNNYTLVSIENYDVYQNKNEEPTHKTTHDPTIEQPTSNPRATTPKEDNNIITKEKKNFKAKGNQKKFPFKEKLIEFGFKEDFVNDWLEVRKAKKATNSKTAFDNFIREVEKSPVGINEVLEMCVVKNWIGFKNQWLVNIESKNNYSNKNQPAFSTNRN